MLSKEEYTPIELREHCIKTIQFSDRNSNAYKEHELILSIIDENISMKYELDQLESDKQKLIEKLEERMKSVEKCYQDLIKPYYDERLNMINVSFMSRKEKEEFTNKRNCLLVQKHCYAEILEIVKGVENENNKN